MSYHLPIVRRELIAEDTLSAWFDIQDTDFSFRAGQYSDFTLINPPETDSAGATRTLSIASSPQNKQSIMITTRLRSTAFKKALQVLPLGTKLVVSRPMGSFTLHKDTERPAVFIVGGIGITPIRSIIEDAMQNELPHRMILCYSNRTPRTTAFLNEFEDWASINKNIRLILTTTEESGDPWKYDRGAIDLQFLKDNVPEMNSAFVYIVGSPKMVNSMIPIVEKAGADPDRIRSEDFAGY